MRKGMIPRQFCSASCFICGCRTDAIPKGPRAVVLAWGLSWAGINTRAESDCLSVIVGDGISCASSGH
jgi:hypothetical protein